MSNSGTLQFPPLTVADVIGEDELRLELAGGRNGLANEIRWVHIIELENPIPFLEGGELLLATGIAHKTGERDQRAYVRRLAKHGLAGLGVGVGVAFADVPPAMVKEADRLDFPVFSVPLDVPFIALTKFAYAKLGEQRLQMFRRALSMQESLMKAALDGAGIEPILGFLCNDLRCSVVLANEGGAVLNQRHWRRPTQPVEDDLVLSVESHEASATLRINREGRPFNEYEMLVLHFGQMALAVELARRGAATDARLRLAGDLLEDLAEHRLDDHQAARRLAAFGLDPGNSFTPLVIEAVDEASASKVTAAVSRQLELKNVRHLSAMQRQSATMLVGITHLDDVLALAKSIGEDDAVKRVGVGRPGGVSSFGRCLVEIRAVLEATAAPLVTYRDVGGLELLLSLPEPTLHAFVDRALGTLTENQRLLETLTALVAFDGRWSAAADHLGIHRHTLRYRMERVSEQIALNWEEPEDRKELWLAIRANAILRGQTRPDPSQPRN